MWLKFLLPFTVLVVFSIAYEDRYSCDFNNKDWCLWIPRTISGNCSWGISNEEFQGNKGYIFLNGSDNCMAMINWIFIWFNINPKMLTFEYYVRGPGPYSINVTSEKSPSPEWTCQIQPGEQKRVGHAAPMRRSNRLILSSSVATGSQLIITQVWNKLLGHKVESNCAASTNTTKCCKCPCDCKIN